MKTERSTGTGIVPKVTIQILRGKSSRGSRTMKGVALLIGAEPTCDVQMRSAEVADKHCLISRTTNSVMVRQLDPNYPVLRNGKQVGEAKLKNGDVLGIGPFEIGVAIEAGEWDSSQWHSPNVPQADSAMFISPSGTSPSDPEPVILDDLSSKPPRRTRTDTQGRVESKTDAIRRIDTVKRSELERLEKKLNERQGAIELETKSLLRKREQVRQEEESLESGFAELEERRKQLDELEKQVKISQEEKREIAQKQLELDLRQQAFEARADKFRRVRRRLLEQYRQRRNTIAELVEEVEHRAERFRETQQELDTNRRDLYQEILRRKSTEQQQDRRETELKRREDDIADRQRSLSSQQKELGDKRLKFEQDLQNLHIRQRSLEKFQDELNHRKARLERQQDEMSDDQLETQKTLQQITEDLEMLRREQRGKESQLAVRLEELRQLEIEQKAKRQEQEQSIVQLAEGIENQQDEQPGQGERLEYQSEQFQKYETDQKTKIAEKEQHLEELAQRIEGSRQEQVVKGRRLGEQLMQVQKREAEHLALAQKQERYLKELTQRIAKHRRELEEKEKRFAKRLEEIKRFESNQSARATKFDEREKELALREKQLNQRGFQQPRDAGQPKPAVWNPVESAALSSVESAALSSQEMIGTGSNSKVELSKPMEGLLLPGSGSPQDPLMPIATVVQTYGHGLKLVVPNGPADTEDELMDSIEKTGLCDDESLSKIRQRARQQGVSLRRELVSEGVLTPYQLHAISSNRSRDLFLGDATVAEVLHHGKVATTYRVRMPAYDEDVALRLLGAEWSHNGGMQKAYQITLETLKTFRHPHVANTLGMFEIEDRYGVIMEYVDGISLAELASCDIPLPALVSFSSQVFEALAAAHRAGFVHHNIRPSRILVSRTGTCKIIGYGEPAWLSKIHHCERGNTIDNYRAPEEFTPVGSVDFRSDSFSVAQIFLELASKDEGTAAKVFRPEGFLQLLRKLTAEKPLDRCQSVEEVLEALDAMNPSSEVTLEVWPDLPMILDQLRGESVPDYRAVA